MDTLRALTGFLALVSATTAFAQVTQRVNVSSSGAQATGSSLHGRVPALSAPGYVVAFGSQASNLVAGDTNGVQDVFVRDRRVGTTELASVDSAGLLGNGASYVGDMTADGRYVAFESVANNLVPGDTNGKTDIFVRDRTTGTTVRVSVASGGVEANDQSFGEAAISDDGQYVVFASKARNLVPGDTNGTPDIFVHDRTSGITERVSVDSNGEQGIPLLMNNQYSCDISADGRFVAFVSEFVNLVPGDTNGGADIFVHNRGTGATERVSVSSTGEQDNGACDCWDQALSCAISADGRFVVFTSEGDNLAPGDANGGASGLHHDVFVHDRQSGATERVSVDSQGAGGTEISLYGQISADGRYVTFASFSRNLVTGDTNGWGDVYLRDRSLSTTERVNLTCGGAQSNGETAGSSISADGSVVVFTSIASNLVPADTNGWDVFIRDLTGGSHVSSFCNPGVSGVIACPCANPPSGPGRGCNNSANTGGAVLSASGATFLSSDSLVFTTSGEKPTSLSVVRQWTGSNATGVVFGQGVRCTSGTVKRMYTKSAVGGSITAPDFAAGDPQVSVRSAAVGDPIPVGQFRWYFVYYRDGVVLGGCPPVATFNATQTVRVHWSP